MNLLATMFIEAITVTGRWRMALIVPLCLAIAIVYKTIRCKKLSAIPRAVGPLWITILLGMYAVAIGLWGLYRLTV